MSLFQYKKNTNLSVQNVIYVRVIIYSLYIAINRLIILAYSLQLNEEKDMNHNQPISSPMFMYVVVGPRSRVYVVGPAYFSIYLSDFP